MQLDRKSARLTIGLAVLASALVGGTAVAEPAPELWVEVTGLLVPATRTPKTDLSANVLSESWWNWEKDGIHLRLVQVQMRKPYSMTRYLRQWRRGHACCATRAVKGFALSSVVGPQRTISGSCEAGDSFAIHFVKVAEGFIELHADSNRLEDAPLRKALHDLIARVVSVKGQPSQGANAPPRPNEVVLYLDGAELQVETGQQIREILRALEDLRTLNPTTLKGKRYADYQNVPGKWTLATLLHRYFVPPQLHYIDEDSLYQDAQSPEARAVIGRQMATVRQSLPNAAGP
jgi:hypothetical protein